MATDIVLRSVKASALTHGEMDQNFESLAGTIDAKTLDYSILYTDQNKIIECTITNGTVTLPTLSAANGTDTDSFRVWIKNLDSTDLTVDGNGAETIGGAASITLKQDECVLVGLNSGATEWDVQAHYGPNVMNITATPSEINTALDGCTATYTELNYNAGVTPGTVTASKTLMVDANRDLTTLRNVTSDGTITGTTVNASTTLQIGGVAVTSTPAEINTLDGFTGVVGDLNIVAGGAAAGVSATEFQYLNGVTSAIQTQLDAKQPLDADLTSIAALSTTSTGRDLLTSADAAAIRTKAGITGTGNVIAHGDLVNFATGSVVCGSPASANTTSNTSSYQKMLEFVVPKSGTINTYIGSHGDGSGSGGSNSFRVYRNGTGVGTARSVLASSVSYTYYSEDITVTAGDLVQAYMWDSSLYGDTYSVRLYLRSSAATAMACPEIPVTYPASS